ncbi:hypothetical protein HRbin04_00134 [archaeon HR04]|nr:hypothetical protein HRbin04_00134 [archaeon HR04]
MRHSIDMSPLLSQFNLFLLLSLITIVIPLADYAHATHNSLPVIEPMEHYIAGKTYDINGIILYNGEPTSDVLVEIRIDSPYGSSREYVRSREDGRFSIRFSPSEQGYYTITATSHCRDVHRSICTYQSTMLEVAVYEEKSIARLCIVGGECIIIDPPLVIAVIDAKVLDDSVMVDTSKRSLLIRLMDVGYRAHAIFALPSHIIDAPSRLSVLVDGNVIEHKEHLASTTDVRIVEITVDRGDSVDGYSNNGISNKNSNGNLVEIIGTYVIPEFPITIVLFALSMILLLALSMNKSINSVAI